MLAIRMGSQAVFVFDSCQLTAFSMKRGIVLGFSLGQIFVQLGVFFISCFVVNFLFELLSVLKYLF